MTYAEICGALRAAGVENPGADARLLLEHFCGVSPAAVLAEPGRDYGGGAFEQALRARCARVPLQYLFGTWEFCRQRYEVSPDCLIPRADTELLVEEYVSPLLKQNIDTLILGCTHYPLLTGIFSKLCGPDVALINPGYEAVSALRELLSENDALRGGGPACGEHYYVSDSEQQFLQYAEMFLRGPVHGQVQRIDIENY